MQQMRLVVAISLVSFCLVHCQQQGEPQKIPPPKWLPDDGKDLFNDIEEDAVFYGVAACEAREKLLKIMAGHDEQGAADHRVRVLLGLGLCELRKQNWDKAMLRFESSLSEMNAPSEDALLKNQNFAPFVLMKQAAGFLKRFEITQGGTQLRRCLEVIKRNVKNVLKQFHKQAQQQGGQGGGGVPPLEVITAEISGYGKTGQYLPMLVKQYPMFKQDLQQLELLEGTLDDLDRKISELHPAQKGKRLKLDVSKGQSQLGSLMYVRVIAAGEALSPGDNLLAVKDFQDKGGLDAFMSEALSAVKSGILVQRTKEGSACNHFAKTCEVLKGIADIQSNCFGETRVVMAKPGKALQLDSCATNANVAVLIAAKDGVSVSVGKSAEKISLEAGKPVIVDFCSDVKVETPELVPLLFAQLWHPEFAGVERTSELRARAKTFGLSEDDVKAAVQVVNDFAKKSWEKSAAHWRRSSKAVEEIKEHFKNENDLAKKKADEAAEARRQEDMANDEDRSKNLEMLERKRAERKQKEQEAEQKRLERKRQLELERANRDPWLQSTEVVEAEKKLAEMKEARRDANAKLEFDLSTQLTKDISAAERNLAKIIKTKKKEYKKMGQAASSEKASDNVQNDVRRDDTKSLLKQLEDVRKRKAAASANEDFAEAKRLKDLEVSLESKLASTNGAAENRKSEIVSTKQELADVKKKKTKASDEEDFAEAKSLKAKQDELEMKLKRLEL